jgi:stage II sporulation protein D
MPTRKILTLAAAAACLLPCAPGAQAKTRLTIRGAGFGHGVGMSQWGAYGYAMHGADYRSILAHYYTGTSLGTAAPTTVRVLLLDGERLVHFSNARAAAGKAVAPGKTYGARATRDGRVDLLSPTGRRLKRVAAPLTVTGSGGSVHLGGAGDYRGNLELTPGDGGLLVVNALGLEDYVRGVVARESPSSWPAAALEAQAVAARTYAVTTSRGGVFDQYKDTRSQVYGGMAAETPATNAAVAATAGQLVTYQGRPAVTYFFSTSGGRTENVENTSLGVEPVPWLKSVKDPYDGASPKHRWGPYRWSFATADRRLGSLVPGAFRGIDVVKRGRSPRIVLADIVGTRGRTRVSGSTLRARLGLYDTWATFTSITTGKTAKPKPAPGAPVGPTGGVTPEARAAAAARHRLTGRVLPAHRGSNVAIQRREGHRWVGVGTAETDRRGRYEYVPDLPGSYRVRYRGDAGPSVRIR